jgi:hypothetical protein
VFVIAVTLFTLVLKLMNKANFAVTCLAVVDMVLRVNWVVLGCLSIQTKYFGSAGWCAYLFIASAIINLGWRRKFKRIADL